MVVHAHVLLRSELLKNIFFCMIQGSCVLNFVKIGPQVMSQSCPQTQDGWTDGRLRDFIFCPMNMHCIEQTLSIP